VGAVTEERQLIKIIFLLSAGITGCSNNSYSGWENNNSNQEEGYLKFIDPDEEIKYKIQIDFFEGFDKIKSLK